MKLNSPICLVTTTLDSAENTVLNPLREHTLTPVSHYWGLCKEGVSRGQKDSPALTEEGLRTRPPAGAQDGVTAGQAASLQGAEVE